jgi:hypothetical protein
MIFIYTVIIFLARNGRTRAGKFRPKNFGRISFDSGVFLSIRANFFRFGRNFPNSANSSAEQWTKFTQIGRNSPEIFEGEPQLRGFAHFEQVSPKKKLLCILDPKARLRFEILFKKTHPSINLTTLFLTKIYLLNTIKSF